MSTREADVTRELSKLVDRQRAGWREEVRLLRVRETALAADLARVRARITELEEWITLADPATAITIPRRPTP